MRLYIFLMIAQLGYAHWFFGNLYEAMVRIPDRLTKEYEPGIRDQRLASLLSAGSPARYFLPGIPIVIGATLCALIDGWTSQTDRPWLGAITLSVLAGVATTAYLVRAVNLRLFVAGQSLTKLDQDRLLRIWYRVNWVRLIASGSALLLAARLAAGILLRTR